MLLWGCGSPDEPWNDPYPGKDATANVSYTSFNERPKHLDPARSYSANEFRFIAQIYEPPLQYHFLERPYTLVPLTATALPQIQARDEQGRLLDDDAPHDEVAFTDYIVRIRPGIHYQPHPAFARDEAGRARYDASKRWDMEGIRTLEGFPQTGSRELTAADYVYQIKRLADPRLNSPIAGLMSKHILGFAAFHDRLLSEDTGEDKREGVHWRDLRDYPMEGLEAIDGYTFRVRIEGRYPQFRYWLAMPFFAPVPWEADRFYSQPGMAERNLTLDWYPVGTGPYMLTENDPNRRMVLERHPGFHEETYPDRGSEEDRVDGLLKDAGRRLPMIDRVVFSLEKENIPYWNKFLQGYYDTSGISSDSFDQAVRFTGFGEAGVTAEMEQRGIRLATGIDTSIMYMGFNMLDPVVGGDGERARKLRQAISIAVDYEEYISIFANGRGEPAQGPIPPGIFGHESGPTGINPFVYEWDVNAPRRRPLEDAKRLMVAAGYPDGKDAATGKPIVLYFDTVGTGPDGRARLNWVRKQYAKLGIQLVIRNTDYNRFQDKMRQGVAQVYQWGWNADYPDPENFLFLLFGPNAKTVSGGENASNYENAAFDRLFEEMKDMTDGPARLEVIRRMVEIVRRDAPWLFGYHPRTFTLYHDWVHNLKPNLMANNTLKYERLDPGLRANYRAEWNRPVLWPIWGLAVLITGLFAGSWILYRRRQRSTAF
ncbi:MAG: ABC transporter substrate-binding protein [Gammaproteobacteria bacterium]|jgi:ABC-type transport system substrate-binding protein|nr:ABC transporter substrate-binding protein [Gammaproteobacteria bacterium]